MSKAKYISEINKAISYIEANIKELISVKSVCEQSHFSKWEFQRIFRAFVGDSIGGYLRGRRLSLAVKDLTESNRKILDIALDYNFSSQESFSRAFKDHFNCTPGFVRSERPHLLSMIKPELNPMRIHNISNNISHQPEIKKFNPMKLIGTQVLFESSLGSDKSSFEKIYAHWLEFNKVRSRITNSLDGKSYGLISASEGDFNQDQLSYLSCVEVTKFQNSPDDMLRLETPEQEYAVFEVVGKAQFCHIAADYIYGIWLPQSNYTRGLGMDLEIFDHKLYNPEDSNSKMLYCIPIRK